MHPGEKRMSWTEKGHVCIRVERAMGIKKNQPFSNMKKIIKVLNSEVQADKILTGSVCLRMRGSTPKQQ